MDRVCELLLSPVKKGSAIFAMTVTNRGGDTWYSHHTLALIFPAG
jgi:hypothetical protein